MNSGPNPKTLVCRKHPELIVHGCQPSDDFVVFFIMDKTGWSKPRRKANKLFMLRYLGYPVTEAMVNNPNLKKPRKERKRLRPRRDFYHSDEWRAVRYQALKKHGATCQCCGSTPKDRRQVHVDHIKPRSKYPELELELSNLQVLCEDCNLGKLHLDETDWRPKEELPEGAEEHLRSLN